MRLSTKIFCADSQPASRRTAIPHQADSLIKPGTVGENMTPADELIRSEMSPPVLDETEDAMAKAAQRCIMAALDHSRAPAITLVDESGHQTEPAIKLPPHALRLIAQVLGAMGERRPITIVPTKHEFTTVEAAHYLNVSRPFIIKEIETGKIKHRMVGTHRRIAYQDLEDYKRNMLGRQEKALQQLADNAQDMGLGY
jgi:excisionase family DNA binding protein